MQADWNDLRAFLAVARHGGLRASALAAGLSPPTLGRRIAALESDLGQQLFDRSASGYTLTPAGEQLLDHARQVEAAMQGVARWAEGTAADPAVRVSAGPWMSSFLADHIDALWQVEDRARLDFVTRFDNADVLRRAVDIDFRSERPTETGLAQRHLGRVSWAIYSGRVRVNGVAAGYFVGHDGEAALSPAGRWLEAHHGDRIGVRGNDVHAVRRLVAAGAGLSVFPCFVGDRDNRLIRLGGLLPDLGNELWLVTHADRRHDRAIRTVSRRLGDLLARHAPLLRGETPRAWPAETAMAPDASPG